MERTTDAPATTCLIVNCLASVRTRLALRLIGIIVSASGQSRLPSNTLANRRYMPLQIVPWPG